MLPGHNTTAQKNVDTKKVTVSYVIRDEQERQHRAGVCSLQYDSVLNRLFSAGRDSIIRTWDCKNSTNSSYVQSLEHHTDWVNDIVLCCGGKNLISASADTTVKVWNAHKGFCMSTLRTHKDYVRALAYAKDQEKVASGGLDKSIFLWDIHTLTALTTSNNTVTTSSLIGSRNSIYSLAMNPAATVIVSGSTEKVLRVWDPRTCTKVMKLIGHSDNVKALIINHDGTKCLSGSSDGTIKLWSLGQQQCISNIDIHKEGVWALVATDSFSHVISAGRDKRIYRTDLDDTKTTLIGVEKNPILKMCAVPDFSGIWVSTDGSDINYWSLINTDEHEEDNGLRVNCEPEMVIKGAPAIQKYHVLNDKRHIITKDSVGSVSIYDVLQMEKVEDLGHADFEEQVKERSSTTYVPNWFSVDQKTGFLTVNLAQNDCFSAWVSAKDVGLTEAPEQKVNYGFVLLKALLEHWRCVPTEEEKDEMAKEKNIQAGLGTSISLAVPQHIPVIFAEVGNRTVYRVTVQDTGGQTESHILNDTVPDWVRDAVVLKKPPKFIKISFYLLSPNEYPTKSSKRERLVANDFIPVHKIIDHVFEKKCGIDGGPSGTSPSSTELRASFLQENQSLRNAIEIICNDQVLDPNMELRAVKHHIWKSSTDLILCYRTQSNVSFPVQI